MSMIILRRLFTSYRVSLRDVRAQDKELAKATVAQLCGLPESLNWSILLNGNHSSAE